MKSPRIITVVIGFLIFRYEHRQLAPASTWIELASGDTNHDFHELYLLGGAHLAMKPPTLETPVHVNIGRLVGDKTGRSIKKSYMITDIQIHIQIMLISMAHYAFTACLYVFIAKL